MPRQFSERLLGGARLAGAALLALSATVVAPQPATAFCGFFVSGADAELYNNASQVVLMRKGNHTVLTMSNTYKGPPEDFAMVVPVPVVLQKENVKTLSPEVFKHIDQLSAPRLVEYWEQDPCYQPPRYEYAMRSGARPSMAPPSPAGASRARELGVTIEAKFEVGEYQILILSAKESTGLETWLRETKYNIPQGAAAALAPYIRDQQKFFVAKVDIKKVRRDDHGTVLLSPLRFGYDTDQLRLPVRLGLLNAENKQDLLVYVLSPDSRYEVSNYPNVFIPTNIEVTDAVRTQFGSFYAELFDETLRRANNRAVVTEYAWQTTSCDPCPTPPLQPSELFTLGDEQIFPGTGDPSPQPVPQPLAPRSSAPMSGGKSSVAPSAPPPMPPPMPPRTRSPMPSNFGFGWVLTRLHTRYDKKTLSEDLIFNAAKPALGGRANWDGTVGDQGAQVQVNGGTNNFQGRYIIRHYWEGAVACKNPIYGRWGGPPGMAYMPPSMPGAPPRGAPQPATDLANAPRGKINLTAVVQSPVPTLGLAGVTRKARPGEKL